MQDVLGVRAAIVHNDEERSQTLINDFREGLAPWIISVKMIAEGVDIPRLRVLVYASNFVKPLFFLQVLFRVVRKPIGAFGESYFFYPADERLKEIVREVEGEVRQYIDERAEEPRPAGEPPKRVDKNFHEAEADQWGATISGRVYSDSDLDVAEAFRQSHGLHDQSILPLVKFFHDYRKHQETGTQPSEFITTSASACVETSTQLSASYITGCKSRTTRIHNRLMISSALETPKRPRSSSWKRNCIMPGN